MFNFKRPKFLIFLCFFVFVLILECFALKVGASKKHLIYLGFSPKKYNKMIDEKSINNKMYNRVMLDNEINNDNEEFLNAFNLLPEEVKDFLNSLLAKKIDNIKNELLIYFNYVFNNLNLNESVKKVVLNLIVRIIVYEKGIFRDELRLNEIKNSIGILFSELKMYEKTKYFSDFYYNLSKRSENFASLGKKTQEITLESIILLGRENIFRDPIICYNDVICVSIDDFGNIINKSCQVEYMSDNGVIIIKIDGNILEIEYGKKEAYFNDEKIILEGPVLSFENRAYIPIKTILQFGSLFVSVPGINGVVIF